MEDFLFYLLPTTFFCGLCILPSLIIGAIAKRKGRSFGWWMFGPVLWTFGIALLFYEVEDGSLIAFYVFPVVWVIYLIAVLIASKTDKKRREEIEKEERWREQIRSKKQPAPKPAPDENHERYWPK